MRLSILLLLILFSVQGLSAQFQTVGLFYNSDQAWNGYSLLGASTSTDVYLIDNCGDEVHRWTTALRPGLMAYLDNEGNLYRTERIPSSFGGGGSGGRVTKYSWEGDILWQYDYSSLVQQQHHDIALMPNGNILILSWDRRTEAEAIAAGRPADNVGEHLWGEKIVEVKPIGTNEIEEVWVWKAWDHMVQDLDSNLDNFGVVDDNPDKFHINFSGGETFPTSGQTDWIHFNSVDYNEELDQIVVSSRHLSEIYIIDHSTTTAEAATSSGGNSGKGGDILYRWGNPISYRAGTINDKVLFGPHNATWVKYGPDQDWGILMYNNGVGRPGPDFSQVDLIMLPLLEDGGYAKENNQPYEPAAPIWSLDQFENESFYSSNISGAQMLGNGNILVCVGQTGITFEVETETKAEVWKYINPVQDGGPVSQGTTPQSNNLFRLNRYPDDFAGFADKDLTPHGPLELNPFPSTCTITTGVHNIEALQQAIRLYPNPSNGQLFVELEEQYALETIEVYDAMGKRIANLQNPTVPMINLAAFADGIYFIRINGAATQRVVLLR